MAAEAKPVKTRQHPNYFVRDIKTTIKEIVAYWSTRQDENGLAVDWAEANELCWRCGYKTSLHRCHIVPDSLDGPDDASNLVLLCGRCHREAPNVTDPDFMWLWLRAHAVPLYDTYWTLRGMEEFEKIFKRKPFSDITDDKCSEEKKRAMFSVLFRKVSVHYGEGRLNPATLAWMLAQIEKQIKDTALNK